MKITVLILTKNEELHIERCIKSARLITDRILVVDSFSSDKTIPILEKLGVKYIQRKWINYSEQFSFAMKADPWSSCYQFRLDADEVLDDTLVKEINSLDFKADGYELRRKLIFNDNWIKYGGYYPTWLTRLFKNEVTVIENQMMDEHMIVSGNLQKLRGHVIDHNLNDIDWWTNKHLGYANRELLDIKFNSNAGNLFSRNQSMRKRWIKHNIYQKMSPVLRVILYFLYRYVFLLGFLDGRNGFYWHFYQGLWYRMMVEYKLEKNEAESK